MKSTPLRRLWPLLPGALVLSVPTAFDLIAFSNILTTFLTQLFSALITLLLGGNVNTIFNGTSTFG